ncbi:MAG TPA: hypothetical protein VEL51_23985 [Vicinamibacterales bacterium]|nr:hypothetical protein [Vicinamibacterales bacterium]
MKATLVLLVLALIAIGAIVLAAEPMSAAMRHFAASAAALEPISMVVSGAAAVDHRVGAEEIDLGLAVLAFLRPRD